MAGFEIKLTLWGVIKTGAKIIPESFQDKELFPCNKMRNRRQLGKLHGGYFYFMSLIC